MVAEKKKDRPAWWLGRAVFKEKWQLTLSGKARCKIWGREAWWLRKKRTDQPGGWGGQWARNEAVNPGGWKGQWARNEAVNPGGWGGQWARNEAVN